MVAEQFVVRSLNGCLKKSMRRHVLRRARSEVLDLFQLRPKYVDAFLSQV